MDDFKLIEVVQHHKCLYDVRNEHYKDLNIRENVWIEISNGLKQPVEDCKTRWKNIRDTYMKHKRNKKLPPGSRRARKSRKWHLEDYLVFLDKIQSEKEAITNTQVYEDSRDDDGNETSHQQIENIKIEMQEHPINEETVYVHPFEMNEASLQDSENFSDEGLPNKRRKHSSRKNTTDMIADLLEKKSQDRQELLLQALEKLKEQEHPIDMFFKSMATSVKALSAERQIRAKMQISQLIGQLELEEMYSRSSSALLSHCQDTSRPTISASPHPSDDPSHDNKLLGSHI